MADALTRPPAARTSSARARSPTRCGGGSRPEPQLTPRLGRSATRSSPRNHAGRLGRIARVGVLGREHDERARELLVDRSQHERKRGLGDARTRVRQLLEERAEALALGKLADERVKDR